MPDAVSPLTPRRKATRQKVLDAAAQVFAELGMDNASVEAICERAGFTRGAFYSNFDSKDDLVIQLADRVARARVDSVRERVLDLEARGAFAQPIDPYQCVMEILDAPGDDRDMVLLMADIRHHALRDRDLARAHSEKDAEMIANVAQIIEDLSRVGGLRFHVPAHEAAGLMLMAWQAASVEGVTLGLVGVDLTRHIGAKVAWAAQLLVHEENVRRSGAPRAEHV